ncbi:MAG TPA: hypothetical protein VF593_05195 [Chthoniobacteraceae bacterium]
MKNKYAIALTALVLSASAVSLQAQDAAPGGGQGGQGGQGGGGRAPSPIMAALDADKDGEISAAEIANAAVALKAADKNGDGKLTGEEVRPARGQRGGGAGGAGGGAGGAGGGAGGAGGAGGGAAR